MHSLDQSVYVSTSQRQLPRDQPISISEDRTQGCAESQLVHSNGTKHSVCFHLIHWQGNLGRSNIESEEVRHFFVLFSLIAGF